MKLQQGQTWKRDQYYIRITRLERLAVEYKIIHDLVTKQGAHHKATKKEFCALIKTATLLSPKELAAEETPPATTLESGIISQKTEENEDRV